MDFDPNFLLLSLIPSGIGFVLFRYGKKAERWPQLVGGLLLMVYPYFTSGTASLVGGGLVVGVALYLAIQLGW